MLKYVGLIVQQVLELWVRVQQKWMYLEGIFTGGDIRTQLPEEARMFDQNDKTFRKLMNDAVTNPSVKTWCTTSNRLIDLQLMFTGLEKCQKSLNDYLDTKRNAFPRFFFISDDELLSILGNSDPACVQVFQFILWVYSRIFVSRYSAKCCGIE